MEEFEQHMADALERVSPADADDLLFQEKVLSRREPREGDAEARKAVAQLGDIRIGDRCQHRPAMGGRNEGVVMAEKIAWQRKRGYLAPAIFEYVVAANPSAENHETVVDPIALQIEGLFVVQSQGLAAEGVDSGRFWAGEGEKALDQPRECDGFGGDVPIGRYEAGHFMILPKGGPSQ